METANRILIIEDEPDVAEMLDFFLSESGYRVHIAAFGLQGLSAARQRNPDLILLDTILPDIDGYSICRELRAMPATAHIPIIFLTRHAENPHKLAALEMGADDFIAKPFDLTELLLRIRNAIQRVQRPARSARPGGLPGGAVVYTQMRQAQADPNLAILEIFLANTAPYAALYGPGRLAEVIHSLQEMVRWALAEDEQSFVGALDDTHLVVIRPAATAEDFAERVRSMFAFQARSFYTAEDRERGAILVNEREYPLLQVNCQVHQHGMSAAARH